MQIPQELPQFTDLKTLIILSGAQAGKVYFAENGIIECVHTYEEPNPSYSDKEGQFAREAHGTVLGAGEIRQEVKSEIRKRYVKKMIDDVEDIEKEVGVDSMYIFAPEYMFPLFKERVPKRLDEKLKGADMVNIIEEHPTQFLARIREMGVV